MKGLHLRQTKKLTNELSLFQTVETNTFSLTVTYL